MNVFIFIFQKNFRLNAPVEGEGHQNGRSQLCFFNVNSLFLLQWDVCWHLCVVGKWGCLLLFRFVLLYMGTVMFWRMKNEKWCNRTKAIDAIEQIGQTTQFNTDSLQENINRNLNILQVTKEASKSRNTTVAAWSCIVLVAYLWGTVTETTWWAPHR